MRLGIAKKNLCFDIQHSNKSSTAFSVSKSTVQEMTLPLFYQVLERKAAAEQFEKANADLELRLKVLPYDQFASEEVKEQVRYNRGRTVGRISRKI